MSDGHDQAPMWTPSSEMASTSRMTDFMKWAGERHGRTFADYGELWRWSVEEVEEFWADIWEYCGVIASAPYERVLDSREMPGNNWFSGARLNYAENMLLRERDPSATAVLHASELRPPQELSWGELSEQVAAVAEGLRSLGVERGDRVAAYMPNIPETLIAFLACASIGAIWTCAAPEFGARSVVDRFAQIEPKVLFVVDGYRHGGKDFDRTDALKTISGGLASLTHTVMLPYLNGNASAAGLPGGLTWEELIAAHRPAVDTNAGSNLMPRFEQLPFDHPLWVLYSSGTTGLPKAIVHGHGGILIEQLKKSMLHLDLHSGDRMFWFTTTGWMMWNFLIGCLFSDAAIVLYDGSPGYPDLGTLWTLAEQTGITCMGVSAGFLMSCEKAQLEPARDHDLSALRGIGSTGSPLPPEGFHWVYEHVGRDLWLFSTSGGTDVCTAFVGGCPLLPVYEGEIQCRGLGCAVEAWDEDGKSLTDELGELVLTEPLPSMPLFLWGDARGERLLESYFDMYPGIWRHGDWIRITPHGGAVIYGRSDSTINRQGVRMGTSELYRATAAIEEVIDALVIDIPTSGAHGPSQSLGAGASAGGAGGAGACAGAPGGAGAGAQDLWMILFVVLREGLRLDSELEVAIKQRIREDCSPRHVPNQILQIAEVPRTLSGKVLEVPVKRILMGAVPSEAASVESLANPHSLAYFVELAERLRPA
jgi:acetoacetyl-CoA synthetase